MNKLKSIPKVVLYFGLFVLVSGGIIAGFLIHDDNKNQMSTQCNSVKGYEWKNVQIKDPDGFKSYNMQNCVNTKTNKIIFDTKYGWDKVNYTDKFSNSCRKDNGAIYSRSVQYKAAEKHVGRGYENLYLYDHFYVCVKNNVINHYVVNTTSYKINH